MRKLTKTAAVVASMAVMAMGTTMMASAATEGWVQSGSNWYYYIKGDKAADQWVKAGDDWYFVDEEGRMVKNTFVRIDKYDGSSEVLTDNDIHADLGQDDIDDDSEFYYMGADGKMITGWKEFKASSIYASPNSSTASNVWYYFGATGRMYVNEWVQSSGIWYALSANGQMYVEAVVNNDLVNWDDDDSYYMDKNGALVKGWYKTTKTMAGSAPEAARANDYDNDNDELKDVFMKDTKWVYGDPDSGVLAEKEWLSIGGKYYFFGEVANTNDNKDSDLRLRTIQRYSGSKWENVELSSFEDAKLPTSGSAVTMGTLNSSESTGVVSANATINSDIEDDAENDASAKQSVVMLSNRFVQWRNHDGHIEYFYLTDSGAALTTWKEYEDDYYICANSKGELYYDEVALIGGKYYYFDEYGVCDYKYLNNKIDYVAVIKPTGDKDYDDDKHLRLKKANTTDSTVVMYETTSNKEPYTQADCDAAGSDAIVNEYDGEYYMSISEMKKALVDSEYIGTDSSVTPDSNGYYDERKVTYRINNRKVTVKSMTDNEVILAYTALNQDQFGEDITVYKLRTSATVSGKVTDPTISK